MSSQCFSRYEFKYRLTRNRAREIRDYIAPFVQHDPYSARCGSRGYGICSLYLDSPDFSLYRATVDGHKNRFKLRIRTYSDSPGDPAFFEIKRKTNTVISKMRVSVDRAFSRDFLDGRVCRSPHLPGSKAADLEGFSNLTLLTGARSVIRIKYNREAYESIGPDPVRITFDNNIMHLASLDGDLSHNGAGWRSTGIDGEVLEIKFTDRMPPWLGGTIRRFELEKQPIPKYVLSVNRAVASGDCFLPFTTLPPTAPSLQKERGDSWNA